MTDFLKISLPRDTKLLTYLWDSCVLLGGIPMGRWLKASRYLQVVEGFRPRIVSSRVWRRVKNASSDRCTLLGTRLFGGPEVTWQWGLDRATAGSFRTFVSKLFSWCDLQGTKRCSKWGCLLTPVSEKAEDTLSTVNRA